MDISHPENEKFQQNSRRWKVNKNMLVDEISKNFTA